MRFEKKAYCKDCLLHGMLGTMFGVAFTFIFLFLLVAIVGKP